MQGKKLRLKIATWNINSVRLRLPLVLHFLKTYSPDVLCLQETKCRDSEFPAGDFRAAGYGHVVINGQKGYHGVATISRLTLDLVEKREFCAKGDARHLLTALPGIGPGKKPVLLHNFYVPAGGDEPDPVINPKFEHKLTFLSEMIDWFEQGLKKDTYAVLVGDLNIAPLETDVWNHKALLKIVSHTPIEVERLSRVLAAGKWVDAMRHIIPPDEKLFTWWSYRSPDWAAADKGRRLDHIWVSAGLRPAITAINILREARGWERPSDHVPVTMTLEL